MTELIFSSIKEILWFLLGSQTAALTTIGLMISAVLFHKSGAGRRAYPWLIRSGAQATWWLVRMVCRFIGKIFKITHKKLVRIWRFSNYGYGAKPVSYSQPTAGSNPPAPQPVKVVEPLSTICDDWVVRTLKSMGFSTAEARAAASTAEVAVESTLDEKVRAALVTLNPLTANR